MMTRSNIINYNVSIPTAQRPSVIILKPRVVHKGGNGRVTHYNRTRTNEDRRVYGARPLHRRTPVRERLTWDCCWSAWGRLWGIPARWTCACPGRGARSTRRSARSRTPRRTCSAARRWRSRTTPSSGIWPLCAAAPCRWSSCTCTAICCAAPSSAAACRPARTCSRRCRRPRPRRRPPADSTSTTATSSWRRRSRRFERWMLLQHRTGHVARCLTCCRLSSPARYGPLVQRRSCACETVY